MSEKALGMLQHMRMQILGHPAPYVVVRGAAVSIGVDPSGSECDGLVDELVQAGYIQTYPSPSLTAHGLYRLTDRGIAAAKESAAEEK
jgi:DNA-binding MarR family transcriptional regulator